MNWIKNNIGLSILIAIIIIGGAIYYFFFRNKSTTVTPGSGTTPGKGTNVIPAGGGSAPTGKTSDIASSKLGTLAGQTLATGGKTGGASSRVSSTGAKQ